MKTTQHKLKTHRTIRKCIRIVAIAVQQLLNLECFKFSMLLTSIIKDFRTRLKSGSDRCFWERYSDSLSKCSHKTVIVTIVFLIKFPNTCHKCRNSQLFENKWRRSQRSWDRSQLAGSVSRPCYLQCFIFNPCFSFEPNVSVFNPMFQFSTHVSVWNPMFQF